MYKTESDKGGSSDSEKTAEWRPGQGLQGPCDHPFGGSAKILHLNLMAISRTNRISDIFIISM
jgi:hypothetical protein